MTTYRFEEVSIRREKNVRCPVCGKRLHRAKTFYQTINPFNRNAQGLVKGRSEIMIELEKEAVAWISKPEECSKHREGNNA